MKNKVIIERLEQQIEQQRIKLEKKPTRWNKIRYSVTSEMLAKWRAKSETTNN